MAEKKRVFHSFASLADDAEVLALAESNSRKAARDAKTAKGRKHYMNKHSKR